ncbi:MAG TPA: alpha/beta hydrolase [Chthonomonadaceae bacterium]|nr:alpha/beta hydrolase [Chthonomonadaceae bacterium]
MNLSVAQLLTWYGTRRRSSVPRRTPADYGVRYQDVIFRSAHEDGVRLSGWIVPAADPRGAVILCHGHGGSRRGTLRTAVMLHRHHFTTLLFDFRACGRSEGACRTLGLNETDDVLGAVRLLRSETSTRMLPIAAIGQSVGGAAVIRAAARTDEIRAVVAEAAFAQLEAVMRRRVRLCVGPFAGPVATTCSRLGAQKIGADLRDIAPEDDVARISPRPILLIQDSLDIVCPRSESNRLYAAAAYPKERWMVPRAPHTGAIKVAPREYERRVADFLVRSIVAPAASAGGPRRDSVPPQNLRNDAARFDDWTLEE